MYQEEMGLLLIKHCNNLKRLSIEQLQAIKEEKDNLVTELAAQKHIIVEDMIALQEQFEISRCHSDIKEKVKVLLSQIAISENESQEIVKRHCTDISKKMLANRKEMNIQSAYEESSFQVQGNLCNIEK
ncbi:MULTISPECIES: hypothetical protein [Pelosinus]|uniref:FlgN family protein n=1 Tax=Pelosinus fermentans B4 TaxID=1149862 RepID=I8RP48_9FIRM|nr:MULTISPECIES: hypothetical protein [Pelosinus]EIW20920.1 hypothetical protein FB4_1772 [Pelosinus fermentans B4]EIW27213.1 hypothetical protein FA11_1232 [Pelosinus fermentans A11]